MRSFLRHDRHFVLIVMFCILVPSVHGQDDWLAPKEVDDPFSHHTCLVHDRSMPQVSIGAMLTAIFGEGFYNLSALSRHDGVEWPATDRRWLWLCPSSGYTSLGDDFNDLSDIDRLRIHDYLSQHYDSHIPPTGILDRLRLMEQIYKLREKDEKFWSRFYRIMAYWSDELGHSLVTQHYRRQALPLLEAQAAALPTGQARMEHLFLIGEYHRLLGNNTRAQWSFSEARKMFWLNDKGDVDSSYFYLIDLISEREALIADE